MSAIQLTEAKSESTPVDYVAWARRANARWIVHHDLSRNAELYLAHLAREGQPRLVSSCRNAYLMVWLRDSMEDPKPWFYSGLFSLATPGEAEKFLGNHWLTSLCVIGKADAQNVEAILGKMAREKIRRIREALCKLPDEPEHTRVSL